MNERLKKTRRPAPVFVAAALVGGGLWLPVMAQPERGPAPDDRVPERRDEPPGRERGPGPRDGAGPDERRPGRMGERIEAFRRDGAGSAPLDRDEMIARLEQRAEQSEQMAGMLRAAAVRLGNGEAMGSVVPQLFGSMRDVLGQLHGDFMHARRLMAGAGPEAQGDGGAGGGTRPSPQFTPLTPDQMDQLREFVSQWMPGLDQRLDALAAQDPEEARRVLGRVAPALAHIRDLWQTDEERAREELRRLERRMASAELMNELRIAVRSADRARAQEIVQQLRTAFAAEFDASIRMRRDELQQRRSRLEAEIAELETAERVLEEHAARREREIDQTVERIRSDAARNAASGGQGGEGGPPPDRPQRRGGER